MTGRLFEPIAIGGLRARNRVVMTAHGPGLSQTRYVRYLVERGRGGVGLIITNAQGSLYRQTNYPKGIGRFIPEYEGDPDQVLPRPGTPEGRAYFDALVIPRLT